MDSGHFGGGSPTGSADEWDMMCKSKRGIKNDSKVLAQATEKLELPFADMESTLG